MNHVTDYIGSAEGLTARVETSETKSLRDCLVPFVIVAGISIPLTFWLCNQHPDYVRGITEGVQDFAYWLLSDPLNAVGY